ncbi:MAG: hypothetical protein KGL11_12875 [Alphaproteobacteria bacterium]|nr:hypothetical protein [Alphaproteobacteria bacterium]
MISLADKKIVRARYEYGEFGTLGLSTFVDAFVHRLVHAERPSVPVA